MALVEKLHPITVEEYLKGEKASDVRHEYVAGTITSNAAWACSRVAAIQIWCRSDLALGCRCFGSLFSTVGVNKMEPQHMSGLR